MAAQQPVRSIQQQAGDRSILIGEVMGDLNVYHYYQSAEQAACTLDLEAYREHVVSQLAAWERKYTALDADPVVAIAEQDFRVVPDSRIALTQAFASNDRLIVLGGAGAGKTTALSYLTRSALSENPGEGVVPIFLELGRFRLGPSMSPMDSLMILVADALFRGRACSEPPPLKTVRDLFSTGHLLLISDGLNETRSDLRQPCLNGIVDLTRRYPNQSYILSSRPHGFSPPEGWEIVMLCELQDVQIPEFLRRYTDEHTSRVLLEAILNARNPLLRLPLFLNLLVRLSESRLGNLERKLRSRSGLISEYVNYILRWDLSKINNATGSLRLECLCEALEKLAQAFQESGQILEVKEALATLADRDSGKHCEEYFVEILEELCRRSLLISDGRSLRFWHHTLQEYFYSAAIVRRWRGRNSGIGRPPRWLRKILAEPDEEDALGFMIAHISDAEAASTLRAALWSSPRLSISWADDLSVEGRAEWAVRLFPVWARRFALRARRYSTLTQAGSGRSAVFLALALGSFTYLFFFWALIRDVADDTAFMSICTIILFPAFISLLDALRCPAESKLEAMLGAIPAIRDPGLRQALRAIGQEISRSTFAARVDLRQLAWIITVGEALPPKKLIEILKIAPKPAARVRFIGNLEMPGILPLLEGLLGLNNDLSRASVDALGGRAERLPEERLHITQVLLSVFLDRTIGPEIRIRAWKVLRRLGEKIDSRPAFTYYAHRILIVVAIILATDLSAFLVPYITVAGLFVQALLIFFDLDRIGMKNFPTVFIPLAFSPAFEVGGVLLVGGWASLKWTPWQYILIGIFMALPAATYVLIRDSLRRNLIVIDWNALQEKIQGKLFTSIDPN